MSRGSTTSSNSPSAKRLQKEILNLVNDPPPGVELIKDYKGDGTTEGQSTSDSLQIIHLSLQAPPTPSPYASDPPYTLQFKFPRSYPFDSPEVTFVPPNIPAHPHVYSNGHICLSILSDDWSPALSVGSVALSVRSMIGGWTGEKVRPPDNDYYVSTCSKNPKKTKWWFHDDTV